MVEPGEFGDSQDAIVIFYKGFSEAQMKAYLDYIAEQHWSAGITPQYLAELAKQNKGMHIVRENDFTRIMVPAGRHGTEYHMQAIWYPLGVGLIKIDESVKGKYAIAICNDDLTIIFNATEKYNDNMPHKPPWSPEVEAAAEEIKRLGGIIEVENKTLPGSPIVAVEFAHKGITGDELEPLTRIPTLLEVDLHTSITDLTYVCRIDNLRTLLLQGSDKITDDALQPLVKLERLTTLSLPGTLPMPG